MLSVCPAALSLWPAARELASPPLAEPGRPVPGLPPQPSGAQRPAGLTSAAASLGAPSGSARLPRPGIFMKPPQLAGCHRSGSRSRACLPGLLKGAAARGPGAGRGGGGRAPRGCRVVPHQTLGAGGRGVLNPTPSNTLPWPRLGARPKSMIPVWVANFHPKTGRGEGAGDGVSRSLLRALGSPFRGGFASQLSLRPTSGEALGSSGCGAPGLSARLMERGFQEIRCLWAAPGVFL